MAQIVESDSWETGSRKGLPELAQYLGGTRRATIRPGEDELVRIGIWRLGRCGPAKVSHDERHQVDCPYGVLRLGWEDPSAPHASADVEPALLQIYISPTKREE